MNIRVTADTHSLTAPLRRQDQVKLQTWFSPSFPVGSFSFSHGLEWAVEAGHVRDPASVLEWTAGVLRYGAGRSDAILLGATWRAVHAEDWVRVSETGALAWALQPTMERRLESLSQGTAFLQAVTAAWPHPLLDAFRRHCPGETAFPVAAGAAACAHGLPLGAVFVAFLHGFAANLVSAGVRLVPLGQTDGLRVIAGLEPTILEVARAAHSAELDAIGSASFLADIASMRHETQYTRLFRS